MTRQSNRAAMPEATAFIDALRKNGIDPPWVSFTESGLTLEGGKRTKDRDVPRVPGRDPRERVQVAVSPDDGNPPVKVKR